MIKVFKIINLLRFCRAQLSPRRHHRRFAERVASAGGASGRCFPRRTSSESRVVMSTEVVWGELSHGGLRAMRRYRPIPCSRGARRLILGGIARITDTQNDR